MSERKTIAWTIRVNPNRINVTNQALDQIIKDEGFEGRTAKRQAFDWLIDQSVLGFPSKTTPVAMTRLYGSIDCDLLIERDDEFFCLEGMRLRTKKPIELGGDPDFVYLKCKGCQEAKRQAREEYERKQAQKDSVKKVLEFRKLFLKIAKDGFFANVRLCSANVSVNGGFFISTDGVTLPCRLQDMEAVNIETVCKMVIDPESGKTPCRYFVEQEHIVRPDIQREAQTLELDALEYKEINRDGSLNLEPQAGELGEHTEPRKVDVE